jgi:hypothetical protein
MPVQRRLAHIKALHRSLPPLIDPLRKMPIPRRNNLLTTPSLLGNQIQKTFWRLMLWQSSSTPRGQIAKFQTSQDSEIYPTIDLGLQIP